MHQIHCFTIISLQPFGLKLAGCLGIRLVQSWQQTRWPWQGRRNEVKAIAGSMCTGYACPTPCQKLWNKAASKRRRISTGSPLGS